MRGRITPGRVSDIRFDARRALTERPACPPRCPAVLRKASDDLHRPLRRATFLAAVAVLGLVVRTAHSRPRSTSARTKATRRKQWTAGSSDPVEALALALEHAHEAQRAKPQDGHRQGHEHGHSHGPAGSGPHGEGALQHLALALHGRPQLPQVTLDVPPHAAPAALDGQRSGTLRYLIPEWSQGPRSTAEASPADLRPRSSQTRDAHATRLPGLLGLARLRAAGRARPGRAGAEETPAGATARSTGRRQVTAHYENAVGSSEAASAGTNHPRAGGRSADPETGRGAGARAGSHHHAAQRRRKSEPVLLRGFNLDHGTDFLTTLDGMPVNLRTHAHGQGYTDLNFPHPRAHPAASSTFKVRTSRQGRLRLCRRSWTSTMWSRSRSTWSSSRRAAFSTAARSWRAPPTRRRKAPLRPGALARRRALGAPRSAPRSPHAPGSGRWRSRVRRSPSR